jgi:hypothetical protein
LEILKLLENFSKKAEALFLGKLKDRKGHKNEPDT